MIMSALDIDLIENDWISLKIFKKKIYDILTIRYNSDNPKMSDPNINLNIAKNSHIIWTWKLFI